MLFRSDVELLMLFNVNHYRTSHMQYIDVIVSFCDGIIVCYSEIAYVFCSN